MPNLSLKGVKYMKIRIPVLSMIFLIITIIFLFIGIEVAKVSGLLCIASAILERKES